jgi:hypothetical protein
MKKLNSCSNLALPLWAVLFLLPFCAMAQESPKEEGLF